MWRIEDGDGGGGKRRVKDLNEEKVKKIEYKCMQQYRNLKTEVEAESSEKEWEYSKKREEEEKKRRGGINEGKYK